jgi:filamentous hemagglutinin family protein
MSVLRSVLGLAAYWLCVDAFGATSALPIPCSPGACGPNGASKLVTSGAATAVASKNALTINQTSNSAILNWASFNIGQDDSVSFKQPSASSIALNRINQASPVQIFGKLSANGQIYLINLNGFLFGSKSTINVGGLLVSSLPLAMSDADFSKGILAPLQDAHPVFAATVGNTQYDPLAPGGRVNVLDANGNPLLDANGNPMLVQVVVQPGAQITAGSQGRILLAGQQVTNGGSLTAPDGQVILAAGRQVFLQADSDPSVRGLVVEVDEGGTAWNQLTGTISTPRGNTTLVGLAVNQDGRISATTSVSANGSIRLEAADTHAFGTGPGNVTTVSSTHGGQLTIGPESDMQILPETSSDATAVDAQTQLASSVTLLGEQVFLKGGSISAPGGDLTVIAAANPSVAAADPSAGVANSGNTDARLRIDAGTSIDLAGSSATLPVTANLVSAQLRANELADDPQQRNGALHGQTVYFDARNPPPASLANLSSAIAAVPHDVAERTENGGHAIFQSEGDLVFAKGASIDVSGGATTYTGAVMQTSYLVGANGQLYPIATANPNLTYVGVLNPTFSQAYNSWGVKDIQPTPGLSAFQPGYVQGAAAGSIQFAAPAMVLQGGLKGSAQNGLYQRTPATAVAGGTLILGLPGGVGGSAAPLPDFLSPAIRFSAIPTPIVVADDAPLPAQTLELPTGYLTNSGFTNTEIYSNYEVTLPPSLPLTLQPGSALSVTAARVQLSSNITDPGGTLSFQNVLNVGSSGSPALRPGVYVDDNVTLDVRGLWTNDALDPTVLALSPTWQNGGKISLGIQSQGALLSVGANDDFRASGGAWVNSKGALTAGTGGAIAINAGAIAGAFDLGANVSLDGFGVGGAAGGTFSLTAPRVEVSNGASGGNWAPAQQVDDTLAPGGVFRLYSNLFSNFGFQNLNLTASGLVEPDAATPNLLVIDPGTAIHASVESLLLSSSAYQHASAPSLDGIGTVGVLPAYSRPAANLSFAALPPTNGKNPDTVLGETATGDVFVGKGASIATDAGGSISLTTLNSIEVDGKLLAPGGSVTLQIAAPGSNYESGFLPDQRIELGSTGSIDVSGIFLPQPSTLGLSVGKISGGGSVAFVAARGTVVTDAGSSITATGTSAPLDVLQDNGSYLRETAATAGGSVTVESGESISLRGNLNLKSGSPGTLGTAAAGSLSVALSRSQSWWASPATVEAAATFNPAPFLLELTPSGTGLPVLPSSSNEAVLGADQIRASGIDALTLESGDLVQFTGRSSLTLGRELIINSPALGTNTGAAVNLSAPYVEIGYSVVGTPNAPAASGGSGTMAFAGSEIDVAGSVVFQGTSNVKMTSAGDLVLRGASGAGPDALTGSLSLYGNLALNAARIYPVSATEFQINAAEDPLLELPGSVTIGQTGANPGTPYSAGATLAVTTDNFVSTGTLYAPFGTITLDASKSLTLGNQSLTSVSGGGLTIPYGQTQLGQWQYNVGPNEQNVTTVPERLVSLTAPAESLTHAATIDLRGGGELSAFEWVPGTGGTKDALAPGATPGLYAILPSTVGKSAPQDPLYFAGSGIAPNATVYIGPGSALPAGFYPLLPARYALIPGAYLIQAEPQVQNPTIATTLPDGTPVVGGYFSYGSTGLHQTPGTIGFAVYPGSYGNQLAEYTVTPASTYFSAAAAAAGAPRPNLPADAGALALHVGDSLGLAGSVLTAAAKGGLAAPISISANDLVIGDVSGPIPADAVRVSGSVLASWQPGSLLIGGSASADGSTIDVAANSVSIGSGTTLVADQIVLVADGSIDVQRGATLESTSASTGTAPAKLPGQQWITLSSDSGGTAALLAVSDLNWLVPSRTGGAPPAGAGTVVVGNGATVASRGSLSFDALGGVTLAGSEMGAGSEWSLGSSSVAFVPTGVATDALSIDPGLVSQLNGAAAVRIASTGSIDVVTPTVLGIDSSGNPLLQSLTLAATSLNNSTGAAGSPGPTTSKFGAQTVTLEGSGAPSSGASAGPGGSALSLTAGTLIVGPNTLSVDGFATTTVAATGAVLGRGTGGLNVGGDLRISSAMLTAGGVAGTTLSADTTISALGAVSLSSSGGSIAGLPAQLGGELTISGASLDIAGRVAAQAGVLNLDSTGNVTVERGASVSAAGAVVGIGNQTAGTPGGRISIDAGGDLLLNSGATIDVAGAGGSAAGAIVLAAGGNATVASTLNGKAAAGAAGGSFSLDAGRLDTPLTTLASSLNAGGFNDVIGVRARAGDLTLTSGASLTANSITLTADSGKVDIAGELNAKSGPLRGTLSLFGGVAVDLLAGGALHADGAGPTGRGGTIEIGTGQLIADQSGSLGAYGGGNIDLEAGSTISASGAAGMGTLLLRAPALVGSSDVAIQSIASNTGGVGQIIIEPVMPFNTAAFSSATSPSAADFQQVQQTVANYMTLAGPAISARLGSNLGAPLTIEPGVEIIADGALNLPALDLAPTATGANWRFNGAPADLTIRAAGDISVSNTISDGFDTAMVAGVAQPILMSQASSSIRLVAGADLSSANPLDVVTGGSGSLALGPGALVRTGTGDLNLVAAKDIDLGLGAGAYTAGTVAIAPGGSAQTPYVNVPVFTGTATAYGIQAGRSSLLFSFATGGGNLTVRAGEDIVGTEPTSPGIPEWEIRQGGSSRNGNPLLPMWGVNLAAYDWNFGTLGGGDLVISAGRDAMTVTAAAANSLLPQFGGAQQYVTGGGLTLTAGRDIGSAQVFLADGVGTVTAGGALTSVLPNSLTGLNVGSAFEMQTSSIDVSARLGIAVDGIFNPTAMLQPQAGNVISLAGSFLSYSDTSKLSLQSVAGDIVLGGGGSGSNAVLLGADQPSGGIGDFVLPPSLTVQALTGNIAFGGGLAPGASILYPAANGQLDLLAARNISNAYLLMSDAAPGTFATVETPTAATLVDTVPFFGAIHANDANPALVTAGGSIETVNLSIPKAAVIYAGKDIADLTYEGQNLHSSDQTLLTAGRDIVDSFTAVGETLNVGGPGDFNLYAGRDVTLGFSNGVTTSGNLLNANLPTSQGANISVLTGLGTQPDVDNFVTKIIAPSSTYQAQLISYVEGLQGSTGLGFARAEAAFNALPLDEQMPLVQPVFFHELLLSGRAANATPGVGFTQGYASIDALYPGSRTVYDGEAQDYSGNLSLSFSRIYTTSGGNISLLVPGGGIDVGLANPPALLNTKSPSQLGIVTQGPGDINIYSRNDVNVNSSRIFTLDGGNILIWSTEGSIDAGKGAKSSVSAPPPTILIKSDGTVSLNFAGSAAGSGIRTIQVDPSVKPGNVDLIAPVGTVNAGDAGIGSAGNINIAAASVIGVSNINFGGTATGVPAEISATGAALSGASAAASGATNAATAAVTSTAAEKEAAAPLADAALSWLDVFVTGLGEENCKPDDIDCLKRQKTAVH